VEYPLISTFLPKEKEYCGMSLSDLDTFTDRHKEIALFNALRGRDPQHPWPLLPILTFIAPGGGGKTKLMEYLQKKVCCDHGDCIIPHAYLEFSTPLDFLPIFVKLRDQLRQQVDSYGRALSFPRFDLGATMAIATTNNETLPTFSQKEVSSQLSKDISLFGAIGEMGNALGNSVPLIPVLLTGLKWTRNIPVVREVLNRLEHGPGWQWYREHGNDLGLRTATSCSDVLLRLYTLCLPGRPERTEFIENILPTAFLADLYAALNGVQDSAAWSRTANVVLFLDGFEVLLESPTKTGMRLLEALTCSPQRKMGNTDPLLVVLGTRNRLFDVTSERQNVAFDHLTNVNDERVLAQEISTSLAQWRKGLPTSQRFLRVNDLYFPVWLQDFGLEDTRAYMRAVEEQVQIPAFTDEALVQAIHQVTHGHPLFVALAVAAVLEAEAHGRTIETRLFDEYVSAEVVQGHQDETIADYLLSLLLRQLSEQERKALIFCAVPRTLTPELLQRLLNLDDIDAHEQWQRYCRLTFTRLIEREHLELHPVVRSLLLQRLPPSLKPESSYYQTHARLQAFFHRLAQEGEQAALLEKAYHVLAVGDVNSAIEVGILAQKQSLELWTPLLATVAQSSPIFVSADAEEQAYEALVRVQQHHQVQDAVTAVVLYTWILASVDRDAQKAAFIQHNLGVAYRELPGGNREENLRRAIACFEHALLVRTRETFPSDWARTQNNLGTAYSELPGGNREENLRRAMACFEHALHIYTQETFPSEWAMTQNNLGNAYSQLPGGNREENLRRAMACYEHALHIYTRETFPLQWAATQHNLGTAYRELPGGNREENLRRAIACFEHALHIYTRETFPSEWAGTQHNLGTAYWSLPGGNREENLRRAIACFEHALQVFRLLPMDDYAQVVSRNLKAVQDELGNVS
jgi:tetratricopeptide (TPR) repeat protein